MSLNLKFDKENIRIFSSDQHRKKTQQAAITSGGI